ncbi:MAG: trypsin-like peptidase domain-containing protein [Armatimonadetes bacterium]|nr:trypsin-like peptidase domain-containing protein [Armatimonadota bacterium]
MTETTKPTGDLSRLSDDLATATATIAPFIVRVDDGTRLTASGVSLGGGFIAGASHAVESDDVSVVTADGTRHRATVVGRDEATDIAILKVEADLPAAPVVTVTPHPGELVLAVARPGDAGLTVTLGVVSQVQETQTGGTNEYIVTTDAGVYPGFSGGALVNTRGEMIGLLNRMYGRGAGVALGVPLVIRAAEAIKAHGSRRPGYLGIRTQLVALPDALRIAQSMAQSGGLLIVSVAPGSAAESAGLFLGDTLLSVNGSPLEDVNALREHLIAGDTITLQVLRGGAVSEITATVAASE